MKVVLATGIYPPQIGGPATYVERLAAGLHERGVDVSVITYGEESYKTQDTRHKHDDTTVYPVIYVSRTGNMLRRWMRYAKALRTHAADADIIYCFSSVSCGVPLFLSQLRGPKKMLRLGGDFLWERYTDRGGMKGLHEWYATPSWMQARMNGLLRIFDHIVFSTAFQQDLYEKYYRRLPLHSVIENALPAAQPSLREKHDPLRLLFLGRFVRFKNLPSLIEAMRELPDCALTLIGDGPLNADLHYQVEALPLPVQRRIQFRSSLSGIDKMHAYADADLLVMPSLTDISPNAALEARSTGLPVLLTSETGLSSSLAEGIVLRELRTPAQIVRAVQEMKSNYAAIAGRAASPLPERTWNHVCEEHLTLFRGFV